MELFDVVDKHCDIRLLRTNCNFRNCSRKPGKEMLILQLDMNTAKRKGIVSLYLCPEHYEEMERVLEGIVGKFKDRKIYKIIQSDLGYPKR
jgi:hypothetical protein